MVEHKPEGGLVPLINSEDNPSVLNYKNVHRALNRNPPPKIIVWMGVETIKMYDRFLKEMFEKYKSKKA